MASVNFLKLHGKSEVSAMIRHCDVNERAVRTHANKDIDISRTCENLQSRGYEDALSRYESRLQELDSQKGANRRKDRVTCFGLEIPAPKDLKDEYIEHWYTTVTDLLKRACGGRNVISTYLHKDEIHDYYDRGEIKKSRSHIHAFIVPEVKGKLRGKDFSSRESMITLNRKIHDVTREIYGCDFMTGEDPRKRTVEDLKRISEKSIQEKEQELERITIALEREKKEYRQLKNKVLDLSQKLEKMQDFEEMRRLYYQVFDDELELEQTRKRTKSMSR